MSWVDWTILFVCLTTLSLFSLWTVRFMKGVADFLAANRSAGRYVLANAGGMTGIGAISVVALFEMRYKAGFPVVWWSLMTIPVSVIVTLTGWVYYRFRETRCLTMAQFLEVRYGKAFRVYSGMITWVSGIVNFGIFPAVASRFFVYYCGLPAHFRLMGLRIDTYVPLMVVTLGMALAYTCLGGQITVMVTDCVQGMFCLFAFVGVCVFLLERFAWTDIVAALDTAPRDASMLNPYHTSKMEDFNVWFFLIGIFGTFYGYMSWQGSQAYQSSGLNPHEQKMGQVIGLWRGVAQNAMLVLLPICAFTLLNLPRYAGQAASANQVLQAIEDETIRTQMTVPVSLSFILPMGIKGLFCAVMIFFLITTQDTYLHSWGSIFVQDVILPFRKKPFTPTQHVRLLRWSITFVAVFAFFYSLLFRQTEYIFMFMAITGAIVSGAGAVIVGGLYWNRGTNAAAWTAMTVGWVMAVGRIILQQIGSNCEDVANGGMLLGLMNRINNVNSQWVWFWIMIVCIFSYVVVSLVTRREPFNMERMLHRGRYAVAGDHLKAKDATTAIWWKITGITQEFTRSDRWLAVLLVVWNFGWFGVFALGTIYNLLYDVRPESWACFWKVWVWLHVGIGVPAAIWFTVGGFRDIKRLFVRLATAQRDAHDDGRVVRTEE